jgi:hypothetical protein
LLEQIEQDPNANSDITGESVMHISLDDPMFMPVIKISNLPGFQAAYREDEHGVQLLVGKSNLEALTRDWFADYFRQLDDLGTNLGAGFTGDWFLEFANGRVWNFRSPVALIVMSDTALTRLYELDEVSAAFLFDNEGKLLGCVAPHDYTEQTIHQVVRFLRGPIEQALLAKLGLKDLRISYEYYTVWVKYFSTNITLPCSSGPGRT